MDKYIDGVKKILEKEIGEKVNVAKPPSPDFGDFSVPCFTFAGKMGKNPEKIASELKDKIKKPSYILKVETKGPYINFFIKRDVLVDDIIKEAISKGESYGKVGSGKELILVESPGPNTNKPLHLGHLRNIVLGTSITNILKNQGKDVHIVNVVNDRGIHICKSMLAYMKSGNGKTPESEKVKSDHFVGDYYVKYSQEEKNSPDIEKEAQELLIKWEKGDKKVLDLWKKMNKWAMGGFEETYKRLGFSVEREYLESETYSHGREIVLKGLKEGIFEKDEEGNIVADLGDMGKKVLLRANGTSVYITQDIYLAKKRYDEFSFNRTIYVVGSEQEHHFRVLFAIFKKLGWSFADSCKHFSYGMVELPEGKMKSREGNVVDTDDLLDEVTILAEEEIRKRWKGLSDKEVKERSALISLCAIKYHFLKFHPRQNFVYNPNESLAFEGDTGPYILYSYARASSILQKAKKSGKSKNMPGDAEIELAKKISEFPAVAKRAADNLNPAAIATYSFQLSKAFNEFYSACRVIGTEEEASRARIVEAFRITLRNSLNLLGISAIEEM